MEETKLLGSIENEQKLISYYLHYPNKVTELDKKYFLNPISRTIFHSVQKALSQGLKPDLDAISVLAHEQDSTISISMLNELKDSFDNFDNIEFHKRIVKNDWIKHHASRGILEDIATDTSVKGHVPVEKLRRYGEQLLTYVEDLETSEGIYLQSTEELVTNHIEIIAKRDAGTRIRSAGFRALNEKLGRPAAAEQYTVVFALTGTGKTVFVKNIENNLINHGVCVVSFNPEMPVESTLDTLYCIREGMSIADLQKKGLTHDAELMKRIENASRSLRGIKNYLYFGKEDLNFQTADRLLYQAKERFRALGVLPEDEYMVVVFDLLSDMEEFDDEDKNKILLGVKSFDKLLKKHKVHGIAVVQANENKIRGGKIFKKPSELDFYKLGLEDIYGGSGYAKKARVVISLHRPTFMKIRFFPDDPLVEVWKAEPDIMNIHVIKQTEGPLFFTRMLFDPESLRINAFRPTRQVRVTPGGPPE